jgi:hypothetical protein
MWRLLLWIILAVSLLVVSVCVLAILKLSWYFDSHKSDHRDIASQVVFCPHELLGIGKQRVTELMGLGVEEEFDVIKADDPLRETVWFFYPRWWPGNWLVHISEITWHTADGWVVVVWFHNIGGDWVSFHAIKHRIDVVF